MKEKLQQLTFEKGITNVPSDYICSDNTLDSCQGLTYHNGEHHIIQDPVPKQGFSDKNDGYTILFVHSLPDDRKNYIYVSSSVSGGVTKYHLSWGTDNSTDNPNAMNRMGIDSATEVTPMQIQAIGKTLIVSTDSGLKYAVWRSNINGVGSYNVFANLPKPDVSFTAQNASGTQYYNDVSREGSFFEYGGTNNAYTLVAHDHKEDYNDAAVGAYAQNKKEIAQKKGFCLPFFIRTALKMYDGSYTHISPPMLMMPTVRNNTVLTSKHISDDVDSFTMRTYFSKIYYKNMTDLSAFSDIVNNVTVFVSRGVEVQNLGGEQNLSASGFADSIASMDGSDESTYNKYTPENSYFIPLVRRGDSDIKKAIETTSIFYKLADLGVPASGEWKSLGDLFEETTLENITTQEQLPQDDYHSFSPLQAGLVYAYNNRLNIADVKRWITADAGFRLIDFTGSNAYDVQYKVIVKIDTDSGDRYVVQHVTTKQKMNLWFFFPDRRAKWVTIYRVSDDESERGPILDAALTEHSGLNGAFFFYALPAWDGDGQPPMSVGTLPYDTTQTNEPEYLYNQIITSEVSNPWVFYAEGYNAIGNGKIIGMSTQTQALSQGQFGAYPLLAFSTDGIWAMSVDNTGLYQSIRPLSREVCNNQRSITQVDGAVFFSSEKGLMVIVGSEVKCVSEQLSGKLGTAGGVTNEISFHDFIKEAFIAYDYRDSLLWIFNPDTGFEEECWIYNIKSGTFSTYSGGVVDAVVNDYPDYLLQEHYDNYHRILSLTERPNINSDTRINYTASFTTRPLKLENAFALKTIMQMKHVLSGGSLVCTMQASNDLTTWTTLPCLRGTPWKYYRLTYKMSDMKATDTFSGTVLITQERHTNKLR